MNYPKTKIVNQIDDYFGKIIQDPYRWLEDANSEETKQWISAQKKTTEDYLSNIPMRNKIYSKLKELSNYEKYSCPMIDGGYYYFYHNNGSQNQDVIYRQKSLTSEKELFFDPNELSEDGTTSGELLGFSPDHKYATIQVKNAGTDWASIKIIDTVTLKWLDEEIKWVKWQQGPTWVEDGFYYNGYEKPSKMTELTEQNKFHKVFFHKLSTEQKVDKLIYEDKNNPLNLNAVYLLQNRKYLFLYIGQAGSTGNKLKFRDLTNKDDNFYDLIPFFGNFNRVVDILDDKFLVLTDYQSPNYKTVIIDPENPSPDNWVDFISEETYLLKNVTVCGSKVFAFYLQDAHTLVKQYNRDGIFEKNVELPVKCSASGLNSPSSSNEGFLHLTSFTLPDQIYRYDLKSEELRLFKNSHVAFDSNDYETKQKFFSSKDGTRIPMFLVNKKGIPKDSNRPALLFGYGGFNDSMTPLFIYSIIPFLEKGGVYGFVNLRGGGEYGKNWHKAGKLLKKQNCFDDFIGAAEYLIEQKYTNPNKIAIYGSSNGGLLVGACMVQRPELFKVAIPDVGVFDMLRFHKFTTGWAWLTEYGSSDNKEEFKYILQYSPLHNIKKGVKYPATMVTTSDHDDRAVPAHSYKFIATLQELGLKAENPYLIRIEENSGHCGSSFTKYLEKRTDFLTFIMHHLDM